MFLSDRRDVAHAEERAARLPRGRSAPLHAPRVPGDRSLRQRACSGRSGRGGEPLDRLRREPVERLDRQLEVLRLRVLERRVRQAAQALDEEHHRRHARARDLGGVVQRARREAVRRARDLADRLVGELDQRVVEEDRLDLPDLLPARPRCSPRRRSASDASFASSSIARELRRVEVALVEQLLGRLDDRGDDARACRRRRPRCTPRRRRPRPRCSRMSSASFAAPASASRRLSIGVEPACAAWPRHVMRERSTPNVPSTTPSGRSSDSSTGPCSMCSSR